MPLITHIKPAIRQAHRVNIFIDGKFGFSLTLTELADSKLHQNQHLTEEEVASFCTLSSVGKLYQSTLEYCFSRPHSRREILDHLKRKQQRRDLAWKKYLLHQQKLAEDQAYAKEVQNLKIKTREQNQRIRKIDFTENNTYEYSGLQKTDLPVKPADPIEDLMIERVILRLEEQNLIDDLNFAKFYVEHRHQSKGISRRRLIQELKLKGVSEEVIQQALSVDEFGETLRDETLEIQKMIKKRLMKTSDRQKLTAYLARQGFSYDLIKTELDHFLKPESVD